MRSIHDKTTLTALTDETLDEVMAAPRAVVIVSAADNAYAARYLAEVGAVAARGGLNGVALAVLDRSAVEGSRFAEVHPWLRELGLVPYTLVFDRGHRVDAFAAVQADVLLFRLARPIMPVAMASPLGPAGRETDADEDWWSIPLGEQKAA